MALPSDDSDINKAFLIVVDGYNGDYYPTIIYEDMKGVIQRTAVRVAFSGGIAPIEVKKAIVDLYRALEQHGLNDAPTREELND